MTVPSAFHVSEELLELYAMGRASNEEAAAVEEHLLLCDVCRLKLEEADAYVGTLRSALADDRRSAPAATPATGWRWGFAPLATAAAFAAAIVGLIVVIPSMQPDPQEIALVVARGESASPTAAAGRPLVLAPDTRGLNAQPLFLQLVTESGQVRFEAPFQPSQRTLATGQRLSAGQYWVRLYDTPAKSTLLREYSLLVQ